MFRESSLDLFGSPAALFFPCYAMVAALCAASPSVMIVFVALSPASRWVSGSCVAVRSGTGRGRVSFYVLRENW